MYSDTIPIPSEGIFYEGRPEYLKVYYMTTEDELNLTTINNFAKGDALINLLKRCVCEPNNLPYEDLLLHDRDYLLLFLRDNAHGYVLDYKDKDTSVYFDSQDVAIRNISRMPDDGLLYTYKFQGDVLKLKLLKAIDLPRIKKSSRLSYYIEHIYSVNDNTDRRYIEFYMNRMPIAESKKVKKYIDSIGFGVARKTKAIINGKRQDIDFNVDESLFGLTMNNLGKIAKNINDSIFFLMNEGNGFTMETILKMPTHLRKLHNDKLVQKINKINESMANNK